MFEDIEIRISQIFLSVHVGHFDERPRRLRVAENLQYHVAVHDRIIVVRLPEIHVFVEDGGQYLIHVLRLVDVPQKSLQVGLEHRTTETVLNWKEEEEDGEGR